VWNDESLELFINANHDHTTYNHFSANLRGDLYDARGGPGCGKFGDKTWNANWRSAAKTFPDHYVMEVAIPYAELGMDSPKSGDLIGQPAHPHYSVWSASVIASVVMPKCSHTS